MLRLRDLIVSSCCIAATKQHLIKEILFITPIAITSFVTPISIYNSESLFNSRALQDCIRRLLSEEKVIKVKHSSIVNLWRILSLIL